MDDRRVVIVDFNHQIHTIMNSNAPRFYTNITIGATTGESNIDEKHSATGRTVKVETTIPNFTLKNAYRWSRQGKDILAVCMDSPCPFRKEYFSKNERGEETDTPYKGGRKPMMSSIYQGIELTVDIMQKAGIPVYKAEGYEADDLIYSLVCICKEVYPNLPIDVITNDADLLPLVDEQVSIWYRSRKFTYADNRELEKTKYYQVTPRNYSTLAEDLSSYKKFSIPYNTLLLHKLLRGDPSDNIPAFYHPATGKKDFPPKMYNELIEYLIYDGVDIKNIFRYTPFKPRTELERVKEKKLLKEAHALRTQEHLENMCKILGEYVDDETLEHIKYIYGGINLRYLNLFEPKPFDAGRLRVEASKVGIQKW